jgi:hypothetical protein
MLARQSVVPQICQRLAYMGHRALFQSLENSGSTPGLAALFPSLREN